MNENKNTSFDEKKLKLEQIDERLKNIIASIVKGVTDPETIASLSDEEVIVFRDFIDLLTKMRGCVKSILENLIDTEERLSYLERRLIELECEEFVHLENRVNDLELQNARNWKTKE